MPPRVQSMTAGRPIQRVIGKERAGDKNKGGAGSAPPEIQTRKLPYPELKTHESGKHGDRFDVFHGNTVSL